MTTQAKQEAITGVTPHLVIRDSRAGEAINFYKAAFGAEELSRMPTDDGTRLMHAHLRINGGNVFLNDDFPEYGGGPSAAPASVTLHLHVDDADLLFERAVAAGAEITMTLADQFWGDRYGQVKDPFGHSWSIGAPARNI